MFQLGQCYIVPQRGNTVRPPPSALPPRLTNEARGANRGAHERWDRKLCHTHTHTLILYTRPYAEKWGGVAPQPCCLNSLQKASDSSPSLFTCATGAASRLFLWQGNGQTHQLHELKTFRSSCEERQKEGMASARFSRAGTLWNNSVHYAWRHWLPTHTNQRPHCVDYLVNLLMPLSSIAGVNVPVFFFLSFLICGWGWGGGSVRLVICFKCFLGNETRWNPAKRTLLSWRAFSERSDWLRLLMPTGTSQRATRPAPLVEIYDCMNNERGRRKCYC